MKKRITAIFLVLIMLMSSFVFAHEDSIEIEPDGIFDQYLPEPDVANIDEALEKQGEELDISEIKPYADDITYSALQAYGESQWFSATELGKEYFDQTIAQYQELEESLTEPEFAMSDAEFFGVFDKETQQWTVESLLNYEEFPELYAVGEAAKDGDYDAAKEAVKAYYTNKFSATNMRHSKTDDRATINTTRLYFENLMTSLTYVGMIKLTKDTQSFTVGTTSAVKTARSSAGKRLSIQLTALKKDGYMGMIYSKESETPPRLEVTVNNRKREYYPIADSYVRALDHQYDNFGFEPVIAIEESYSTINSPISSRIDNYTQRGYLMFDLSDINTGDTINNAELFISGQMINSENPMAPQEVKDYKDIVLLQSTYTAWNDNNITWSSSTDVGSTRSFDGEYGNIPTLTSGSAQLNYAMRIYMATNEKAYAYLARRMLMGFIRMAFRTSDGITAVSSLTVSAFTADFPYTVATMINNPYLTDDDFTMMLKFIHALADRSVNQWGNSEEKNNWGEACMAAVMISALVYPEFRDASKPLEEKTTGYPGGKLGGWRAVGEFRMLYCSKKDTFADGACIEVPFSYVTYLLNLFKRCFTASKNMNLNIRDYVSDEALAGIETYLIYAMNMSNPQALGGGWGQGQAASYTNTIFHLYDDIIEVLNNPLLDWAKSGKKEGNPPPYKSVVYDTSAKAVLRSDWTTAAMAAQIQADGGNLSHGMNDDLGLNVYAYGKLLLVDPLQPNYTTSQPVTGWLHSTRAHNTIEINDISQKGAVGINVTVEKPDGEEEYIVGKGGGIFGNMHPENREFNDIYNFLRTETYNYQNYDIMNDDYKVLRDVLFIEPSYFIVTDYVKPMNNKENINKYSQYWHFLPNSNLLMNPATGVARTRFASGANIVVAPVEQNVTMGKRVMEGWYQNVNTTAQYLRFEKETADATTFNTLLYPTRAGVTADVTTQKINLDLEENEASAFKFTIKESGLTKNGAYYSLLDTSKQTQRNFGKYTTDGTLSLVQENNGNYYLAVLRNGTNVTNTDSGHTVIKSESIIPELGVMWSGEELHLQTSKHIVKESLKEEPIYDPSENLALGKPVISSDHYATWKPEYATDGSLATGWKSFYDATMQEGDEYPWLMIDLEATKRISMMHIYDDVEELEWKVEYSNDGANWEQAEVKFTKEMSLELYKFQKKYYLDPIHARFIRLTCEEGRSISLYEVECYPGEPSELSLEDLSIYAPAKVKKVLLNNISIDFSQKDDIIRLVKGNNEPNPIEPTPPPKEESKGDNHGYGGGNAKGGGSNIVTPTSPPDINQDKFSQELKGHWGETEIRAMIEKGVISGNDEGSLDLSKNVTRAEFAALLVRALDLPIQKYQGELQDVDQDTWFADYIATAFYYDLLQGDGLLVSPENAITREQMAKMLVKAYQYLNSDLQENDGDISYRDKADISSWAYEFVAYATNKDLMKGMDDNLFNPKYAVRREQAFVAIYRLLQEEK